MANIVMAYIAMAPVPVDEPLVVEAGTAKERVDGRFIYKCAVFIGVQYLYGMYRCAVFIKARYV